MTTTGLSVKHSRDFYLPGLGLYVECTVMRQALASRKRRKVRMAHERLGVHLELLFRRDLDRLARRWGLARPARAVDSPSAGARPPGFGSSAGRVGGQSDDRRP